MRGCSIILAAKYPQDFDNAFFFKKNGYCHPYSFSIKLNESAMYYSIFSNLDNLQFLTDRGLNVYFTVLCISPQSVVIDDLLTFLSSGY